MNLKSTWSVLEESTGFQTDEYAFPATDKAVEEAGFSPNYFTWVSAVNMFSPDSFTIADFMRIFPYGLKQVNESRLASALERGFLTFDGQGQYRATELGINIGAYRVFKAANAALAQAGLLVASPSWAAFMVKPLAPDASEAEFRLRSGLDDGRFLVSFMDVT